MKNPETDNVVTAEIHQSAQKESTTSITDKTQTSAL